jgi:hypothetical protein
MVNNVKAIQLLLLLLLLLLQMLLVNGLQRLRDASL